MQISSIAQTKDATDADTIAIGVFEGDSSPPKAPAEVAQLLDSGEARRSFKSLALTHAEGKRWLVVGLGPRAAFTPERARVAASMACARARELSARTLCWEVPGADGDARSVAAIAAALVEGTILGDYRFDQYKSKPTGDGAGEDAPPKHLERLIIAGADGLEDTVAQAAIVAEAVNRARDLQNRPGNDLTPTALGEYAKALAQDLDGLSVEVEGRDGILARGMGAFAAVAQGSDQEPALITLKYEAARGRRSNPRLRRQGGDVRQRRHLAEARGENGGDEVRHVRRRSGDRGGLGDRAPAAAGAARGGGRRHGEPAEWACDQARRHRDGRERQDDRDQQHRRRGQAGAGRLPVARHRRRAPSGSSTWRR